MTTTKNEKSSARKVLDVKGEATFAKGFDRGYNGADLEKIGERTGKSTRVKLATSGAPDPRKDPAGFASYMLAIANKATTSTTDAPEATGAGPGASDAPNAPE
jgi:hypothetical protein